MKQRKLTVIISLFLIVLSSCQWGGHDPALKNFNNPTEGHIVKGEPLPYFGPLDIVSQDTAFFQIPKFFLTDQNGQNLGYKTFKGKPLIVEFFFTKCSTICPIMTKELVNLQQRLEEDNFNSKINFLSITIDPENDTTEVLKSYIKEKGVNEENWKFAFADMAYTEELSKEGFFLAIDRNAEAIDGVIHSSQVVLVDEHRHIRGAYDAVDQTEMERLYKDLNSLMK